MLETALLSLLFLPHLPLYLAETCPAIMGSNVERYAAAGLSCNILPCLLSLVLLSLLAPVPSFSLRIRDGYCVANDLRIVFLLNFNLENVFLVF